MSPFRVLPLTQAILAACAVLTVPQIANANPDVPLPTGQYITPIEPDGAVQQLLNPGLSAYPNFVAGGAVTARLSPDGSTLAILCAGQNTLYKENGSVDSANSTQYLFLYDVADANKHQPKLIQVIKQTNAHVGLVWMPDGKRFLFVQTITKQVDAPYEGKLTKYMGFNFLHSERLQTSGANLLVPCWAKSGMHLGTWDEIGVAIGPRADKNNAPQVQVTGTFGATRLEEKKVVQILCA